MKTFLMPYASASQGSANLADRMDIRRIKRQGSKFQPSRDKTIINWGCAEFPLNLDGCRIINRPQAVLDASDKLRSFRKFQDHGVPTVPWCSSLAAAREWLLAGKTVFARTVLRGHSGNGIRIMEPDHEDTWNVNAQLYTQYVPKQSEYRIHVVRGEVIDIQRKAIRQELVGRDDINWKIRNLANGFVFMRADVNPPQSVLDAAIAGVNALGLDFGAADVIYNDRQRRAYCIEVNSAPGIENTTVERYAAALERICA